MFDLRPFSWCRSLLAGFSSILLRQRMLRGVFDRELDQLGKLLMVLLEKPEGPQGLDAGGDLGSVREFAGCAGVLVDGDSGIGGLGSIVGGFRVIVRLKRYCQ